MSAYEAIPSPESPVFPFNLSAVSLSRSTRKSAATREYDEIEGIRPSSQPDKPQNLPPNIRKGRIRSPSRRPSGWALEISGCVLGILTIVLTVLVLAYYNGHSLPVVLSYNVKLGSILSIFSTMIKGAIGLPLAAGLSQIVWSKLRQGRRPLIDVALFDNASRGMMGGIALLWSQHGDWVSALGILCGLLALAIGPTIQETLGSKYTTGISTLPICVRTSNDNDLGQLFDQYQASVFLSSFNPSGPTDESLQSLNTNCLSGACEWPTFASLAICSETTDLYNQTNRTYNSDGSFASLTLPNGLSLPDIGGNMTYSNGSSTFPTMNYNNLTFDPIARFSLLFYHWDYFPTGKSDYRAAEGIMYWCVQSYEASVKSNILSSKIKSVWRPDYMNSDNAPSIVLSPPKEYWEDLGLTGPTDFIMNGSMTLWHLKFIELSIDINNTKRSPPNQLEVIAGLGITSFPDFFSYLASAMTNRLRGTVCNETVDGNMNQEQVLKVEWKWLALPSITVVLVCIFLAAVISESRSHNVEAWKSNILATLFHGLSEEVRVEYRTAKAGVIGAMEEKAKGIYVQLRDGDSDDTAGLLLRS